MSENACDRVAEAVMVAKSGGAGAGGGGYKDPPKGSQFRKGNPGGPGRGNKGPQGPSLVGERLKEELARALNVTGGSVEARTRLLQQLMADAINGDARVNRWILELDMKDDAARAAFNMSVLEWFIPRKAALQSDFDQAQRRGDRPLDCVPHPAHINFVNGGSIFTGPTSEQERVSWEWLKFNLWIAAECAAAMRQRLMACPDDIETAETLARIAIRRRAFMRKVPKGWNWREQIYSLDNPDHRFTSLT